MKDETGAQALEALEKYQQTKAAYDHLGIPFAGQLEF